ncbi:MAG: polyprenyl synthetase family protein [Oscillospiraceae bacterium]|nr:polyprenyl synthetase family protein [Oscillospiraceae bacterium]
MSFDKAFQKKIALVEQGIADYLRDSSPQEQELSQAVAWALSGGGKRVRPVLTLAFVELFGAADSAMPFALAVELIHSYSLVHDDLPCMDNADTRRGKPSVHKQFGETIALLTGDILLTDAFGMLTAAPLPANAIVSACQILAESSGARGGMISGQVFEWLCEKAGNVSDEDLQKVCEGKTAALLEAACMLGVLAGGGDDELLLLAKTYARGIGLAFQMVDDIFDLEEDKAAGRSTFATLWGIEKTRRAAHELTAQALKALDVFKGDKSFLAGLAQWLLSRDS